MRWTTHTITARNINNAYVDALNLVTLIETNRHPCGGGSHHLPFNPYQALNPCQSLDLVARDGKAEPNPRPFRKLLGRMHEGASCRYVLRQHIQYELLPGSDYLQRACQPELQAA